MTTSCRIALPAGYRTADIIAYHLRDPSQTGERWDGGVLYKGFSWQGIPVCLALEFNDDHVTVRMEASVHAGIVPAPFEGADPGTRAKIIEETALTALVQKMLGLDQDINGFEQAVRDHPELGPLVQMQRGLRVPVATTPFEALVWAVLGQQISVQAAISIRRRFIQAVGCQHHNGLWCHPDAQTLAVASADTLRQAGLSAAKAQTLLAASQAITEGRLVLADDVDAESAPALQEQLMSIRGIGVWTADYTLLRGYGWLDGSLHGDAAVRRGLRMLLKHDDPVSADMTREWLMEFSPWRALAAAHLWASLKLQA